MRSTERLATGCEPLDEILGGGVEKGVITNVYGPSGSGKTNICVQAITSCIEKGGTVVLMDTEGGFSSERFLQMHGQQDALDNLLLMEPMTFDEQQDAFDELEEIVTDEDVDLVVVDSLVSLYRIQLSDEVSETNRELSRQLSILSKIARSYDIPVIVTNQVYSSMDNDSVTMVGRDVPTYWSKCLIELEKLDGNTRRATVRKHRSRPAGVDTAFAITGEGLDAASDDEVPLY